MEQFKSKLALQMRAAFYFFITFCLLHNSTKRGATQWFAKRAERYVPEIPRPRPTELTEVATTAPGIPSDSRAIKLTPF